MIDGLVALLESDVQTRVNIDNPDERTINELTEMVLEITASDSEIIYKEFPLKDPKVRRPDIPKAKLELAPKARNQTTKDSRIRTVF